MLEKFAWGMREVLEILDVKGVNDFMTLADKLCESIDPEFNENRRKRYQANADLSFGRERENADRSIC
jgi:hypothetical protein